MFTKVNTVLISKWIELENHLQKEDGATTAEYAITVLAACAFAALLFGILSSGEVRALLLGIITKALNSAG